MFPRSQACPCPFADLFCERLSHSDEVCSLAELYQAYRGMLCLLGREDDKLGTEGRLAKALQKSAFVRGRRGGKRGYLCEIVQG